MIDGTRKTDRMAQAFGANAARPAVGPAPTPTTERARPGAGKTIVPETRLVPEERAVVPVGASPSEVRAAQEIAADGLTRLKAMAQGSGPAPADSAQEDKITLKMRAIAEAFELLDAEIHGRQQRAERIWNSYAHGTIKRREQAEPNIDWGQVDYDRNLQRLNPRDFGGLSHLKTMTQGSGPAPAVSAQEDKITLKMREVALAEAFECLDAEIHDRQQRAERIWNSYAHGTIEHREQAEPNIDWRQVDHDSNLQRLNPRDFGYTTTSATLKQELQGMINPAI